MTSRSSLAELAHQKETKEVLSGFGKFYLFFAKLTIASTGNLDPGPRDIMGFTD